MRISYSSLDTYKTCPLKFKYQELDKIRVPKGAEAVFGSAVHASLKYMFERNPLYPTLDQVVDYFRGVWDAKKASITIDAVDSSSSQDDAEQEEISNERRKQAEDMYYKDGVAILEKFYKKNSPWNFNVVEMESRFQVELEDPETKEKHQLAGIIDRVDKTDDDVYEIIDYKTGKKMPSQQIIDGNTQMSIYHLALLNKWPHLDPAKIKLSLYFLKHGEKISTSRLPEDIEKIKNDIIVAIREISEKIKSSEGNSENSFPATPSGLCDYCGYKQMCPMWRHLYASKYEKEKIHGQKELEKCVAEFFALKAGNSANNKKLAELKIKISNFMDEQKVSRVFGDEGFITKKMQERVSYDESGLREILEPIGKWEAILEPDDKKLIKLLPFLSLETQQQISTLQKIKRFFTFTATKKKGGEDDEDEED